MNPVQEIFDSNREKFQIIRIFQAKISDDFLFSPQLKKFLFFS